MPSLTLGEAFVPGSDDTHFCQPTDVAVSSSGVFFVSDGYCNKRILKYDAEGHLIDTYQGSFNVPHSLTLIEELDALCVADRENSRIVCIHAGLDGQSKFGSSYGVNGRNGKNVGRVFAVAGKGTHFRWISNLSIIILIDIFDDAGQKIYAVFGSIFVGLSDGKTFDLDSLDTLSRWTPSNV